ncbi:MAG: ATP phosphoribosyltransferase regulatory subunit [Paracoccaceae bacterium]|jgi:ATP phosphoribosyltransferase regulatory subunit
MIRSPITPAAIRAESDRILAVFEAAGAVPFSTGILQPAETLLDLYGEDIRARAYVTRDPLRGEQMLRPDFTVPVVQAHMQKGAEPARYAYAGEVFRKQEHMADRPNEYMQVGFELFDRGDQASADAEVFALMRQALGALDLRAAIGDIGLLQAAVQGLQTSERRRAALRRHLWRPRRFRALLDRFSGRTPRLASRKALLGQLETADLEEMIMARGPEIGLRSFSEIADRIEALHEDEYAPPIDRDEVQLIDDLLSVRAAPLYALEMLRDLAVDMPDIEPAVGRLEERLAAMAARGIDLDLLEFETSYGRTTLEYYDGFVFGFYADRRADLPPVATGGRYDALTRVLGRGRAIPAVGGVIRPALVLEVSR